MSIRAKYGFGPVTVEVRETPEEIIALLEGEVAA